MLNRFLALIAVLGLFASSAQAYVLIDDFTGPYQIADNNPNTVPAFADTSSAATPFSFSDVADTRTIETTYVYSQQSSVLEVSPQSGVFSANNVDLNGPGGVGTPSNTITWTNDGGSSFDITSGGSDQIFVLINTDNPVNTLLFNAVDADGDKSTVAAPITLPGGFSGVISFLFSDFAVYETYGNGSTDLDSLVSLQLWIEQSPNADTVIDAVWTGTPEPASMAVWGMLGFIGLGLVKFRSKLV